MPPRRAAPAHALPPPTPPSAAGSLSTELFARLQAALNTIKSHEVFRGIVPKDPLTLDATLGAASGFEEPFALEKFQVALSNAGRTQCAANIFWHDFLASGSPGVPESARGVDE